MILMESYSFGWLWSAGLLVFVLVLVSYSSCYYFFVVITWIFVVESDSCLVYGYHNHSTVARHSDDKLLLGMKAIGSLEVRGN
jgi:hypothetical protein